MNTSHNPDFHEATLLTGHAINMALVELSVLDQQSIKTLQSVTEYKNDVIHLLEGMKSAKNSLGQAKQIASRLVKTNEEVAR